MLDSALSSSYNLSKNLSLILELIGDMVYDSTPLLSIPKGNSLIALVCSVSRIKALMEFL